MPKDSLAPSDKCSTAVSYTHLDVYKRQVNTHRLLVRGSRVSYAEGAEEKAAANSAGWRPTPYELGLAAGAGLLAVMGAGTLALRRRGPRGRHARR